MGAPHSHPLGRLTTDGSPTLAILPCCLRQPLPTPPCHFQACAAPLRHAGDRRQSTPRGGRGWWESRSCTAIRPLGLAPCHHLGPALRHQSRRRRQPLRRTRRGKNGVLPGAHRRRPRQPLLLPRLCRPSPAHRHCDACRRTAPNGERRGGPSPRPVGRGPWRPPSPSAPCGATRVRPTASWRRGRSRRRGRGALQRTAARRGRSRR